MTSPAAPTLWSPGRRVLPRPPRNWPWPANSVRRPGRPGWPRLGLIVTPDHQTIYVDKPDNPLAVLAGKQSR
jgi:hypothetical protein